MRVPDALQATLQALSDQNIERQPLTTAVELCGFRCTDWAPKDLLNLAVTFEVAPGFAVTIGGRSRARSLDAQIREALLQLRDRVRWFGALVAGASEIPPQQTGIGAGDGA